MKVDLELKVHFSSSSVHKSKITEKDILHWTVNNDAMKFLAKKS